MNRLPDPPAPGELARIPAVVRRLPAGTVLWRVHFQAGPHPAAWNAFRAFGPTQNRFDHHLPPPRSRGRSILYASLNVLTCFAEVFQETHEIDVRKDAPALTAFAIRRPLRLLDLRGVWPTRAGGSLAINAGERGRSRAWSRAIYRAYPRLHGLWYASSMDANRPAVALYDRAVRAMPAAPAFYRQLQDPALADVLRKAAARFRYDVQ